MSSRSGALTAWLADHGFDPGRLAFAGRTAVAACLAFVGAWALGLEHPQWAGMAVWAASQPTRGQLIEKSFFRALGTLVGATAGVLLVVSMEIHPALLVVGLAAWVGACTYVGNLQRGLVAYGTVLAGYTAAMVALLDTAHPEHVLDLATDRLATVLTGVVMAMLVGYLFAPPLASDALKGRVLALLAGLMDRLAGSGPQARDETDQALLSEIGALEEGLDPHAAGSLRSRRDVHAVRRVLLAAVQVLLLRRDGAPELLDPQILEGLRAAAIYFRHGDVASARAALETVIARLAPGGGMHDDLAQLRLALEDWQQRDGDRSVAAEAGSPSLPVVLHRDWVGARESTIRAAGCLLFFGAVWLVTGWTAIAFLLLGLSIMLSLFSTMENPARLMRSVLLGQVYGAIGALTCRWLVWPLAGAEWQIILLTLPFILVGPLLVGHRRTAAASFDYNMVMLLLLQPHWPLTGSFVTSLSAAVAVTAAPVIAIAAYNMVYPPTLQHRLRNLLSALLHDIADLAADTGAVQRRWVWQARLYHRTLRLVRLSERSEKANLKALDAGLALLNLGRAAIRLHELQETATSSGRRAIDAALARMSQIATRPQQASGTLEAVARRLQADDAVLLRDAADGIAALRPYLEKSAQAA